MSKKPTILFWRLSLTVADDTGKLRCLPKLRPQMASKIKLLFSKKLKR
jgi:hypothetical protein